MATLLAEKENRMKQVNVVNYAMDHAVKIYAVSNALTPGLR